MSSLPIEFPGLGLQFNPSRVAFVIFGKEIYWYGVIIAFGFLLAVAYCYYRAKRFGIEPDDLVDMLIIAVPVALVCARAYYVIFNFSLYRAAEGGVDWGRAVAVWDGGLAIYGGIIGGLAAAFFVSRYKKIKPGAMLDLGSLGLLIGQAVGRWGNLINREAFGTETTLPWRMRLYRGVDSFLEVHPTFLYESLWNTIGFVLLALFSRRKRTFDGQVFLLYIAWYGFGRGLIESMRVDSLMLFGSETIRVSQLLGFFSCVVAAALVIYFTQIRPRDPADMLINRVAAADAGREHTEILPTDEENYVPSPQDSSEEGKGPDKAPADDTEKKPESGD